VLIDGTPVTGPGPDRSIVFQSFGLLPWKTVLENVAFPLQIRRMPKQVIHDRCMQHLDLVGLRRFAEAYPHQLSGGMQQRVGLARALATDPDILLMDEPFGAIDAITRASLQDELLRIQRHVRKTVLFVTHDVEEAVRLADRIVVMREGRVVQYATPLRIVMEPADAFVADLVGAGDVLRRLSLLPVSAALQPLPPRSGRPVGSEEPTVLRSASLRVALAHLLESGADRLAVVNEDERPVGVLDLQAIQDASVPDPPAAPAEGSTPPAPLVDSA
jgi:osmoprotectant transport system ATP-binding protein